MFDSQTAEEKSSERNLGREQNETGTVFAEGRFGVNAN